MNPIVSRQQVRFDDVDGAGIVYYPRFLHFCHKAFEDWFDGFGPCSYPVLIREKGIGFPTVHVSCDYSAPLIYGDVARVSIEVMEVGNSSLKSRYRIHRESDGVLCFLGHIVTVCMDLKTHKKIPLQGELRQFLKQYQTSEPAISL